MEGEQAGRLGSSARRVNSFFSRQSPLDGDQVTWHHEKALDSHCWDVRILGCEHIQSQHEKGACAGREPALLPPPR